MTADGRIHLWLVGYPQTAACWTACSLLLVLLLCYAVLVYRALSLISRGAKYNLVVSLCAGRWSVVSHPLALHGHLVSERAARVLPTCQASQAIRCRITRMCTHTYVLHVPVLLFAMPIGHVGLRVRPVEHSGGLVLFYPGLENGSEKNLGF